MPIELVDCHTHTVFSDGKSTFQENMKEALAKGITTIACTCLLYTSDAADD